MALAELMKLPYDYFESPLVLLWIIPMFFLTALLLRHQFVKLKDDPDVRKRKRRVRNVMMFTRTFMLFALLVALATPYVVHEIEFKGDPVVRVLSDNSSSMHVFDISSEKLVSELKNKIQVEARSFGSADDSPLGDALIGSMGESASVLVVSDGQVTSGTTLSDVGLLAQKFNASVSAISLDQVRGDASVEINGPGKTLDGVDNTFLVHVRHSGTLSSWHLKVSIDDEVVFDKETSESVVSIPKKLKEGYHRLVAQLLLSDAFAENNVFYKSVKAVAKPEVFLVSPAPDPLIWQLLRQSYTVQQGSVLPSDLSSYYAVVLDGVPASTIKPSVDGLTDFVINGNGLVVLGGKRAYEFGGYKDSSIETILPVTVGSAEREEGDVNVAVVADISGSMGAAVGLGKAVELGKSLIVSVLRDLAPTNKVGLVAFNKQGYILAPMKPMAEQKDLEDTIASLKEGGGTLIYTGLAIAIEMLRETSGSKNIIILTDGQTQSEQLDLGAVAAASQEDIRIYAIGVGTDINSKLLSQFAEITGGIYFQATESSRIKLLFGDLQEAKKRSEKNLVVLNPSHFITSGMELKSKISGFNQVLPKRAAQLLVTTDSGEPVLVVWRLGLGRTATIATDDGAFWAGDLLGKDSKLHTRTLSWAVGDPDRKSKEFIDIEDARVGGAAQVLVRSSQYPQAAGFTFYKTENDLYAASFMPNQTGFSKLLTGEFATNYPQEFTSAGANPELEQLVHSTGGRIFSASDVDGISKFVTERLKRKITAQDPIRLPFLIVALLMFLVEVLLRRLIKKD